MKRPIKKLDNYRFLKEIGKGASAKVYLAVDDKSNELVAIKSLDKNKLNQEHGETNFKRELEILHKMNHNNIIKIKNYLNTKKHYHIVLEYCNGGDLESYCREYIRTNKHPLNEFYIQKILLQIAPALQYMHSNKIIHRDIKLQNILLNFDNYPNVPKDGFAPEKLEFKDKSLNKDFSAKIADLGYAKDFAKDNEGSTILGSPMYMSPDIVEKYTDEGKENKKYNTSVDLWSLGVITYELLTGETPFIGKTYDEVFKCIKNGIYSLPKNLRLSIEIISFINGLLQYYPEKRFTWEQINSHPFLTKNVEDFTYIDLEMMTENEKEKIEINSKNSDNLLWIFFKCKNMNVSIGTMNQREAEKPEVKQILEENKVANEEVKKAIEQEKMELEKEKQKIQEMKKKAEEEKKKVEAEKMNRKKELEKLINDEKNIKIMQEKLTKETEEGKKNSEESNKKLKELERQLQQVQNDKDLKENKLKNVEQKLLETEKLKKFAEKQINKLKANDEAAMAGEENEKNEIIKLQKEKMEKEEEMKKLKEEEIIKENKYKKDNDFLQKKIQEMSVEKKFLEEKVNDGNNQIKERLKSTNDEMEMLKEQIKIIEEEKERQIKIIQEEKKKLELELTEFSRIIREKKEMSEKGIFSSCIEIKKEEIAEEDKNKEEEKEIKKEEDDWEQISEKDLESDDEFDVEDYIMDGFEIVESYVDDETDKNDKIEEEKKEN